MSSCACMACPSNSSSKPGSRDLTSCTCNSGYLRAYNVSLPGSHGYRMSISGLDLPNLLLDSTVTVSDECYTSNTGKQYLNDGSDGPSSLQNSEYWHSCSRGNVAWAQFNLSKVSTILRIEIVNRPDAPPGCCGDRLTGASIHIFDSKTQQEVLCGRLSSTAAGERATIEMSCTACRDAADRAGYIKIYGPDGGSETLNIAEVKAYGDNTEHMEWSCVEFHADLGEPSPSSGTCTLVNGETCSGSTIGAGDTLYCEDVWGTPNTVCNVDGNCVTPADCNFSSSAHDCRNARGAGSTCKVSSRIIVDRIHCPPREGCLRVTIRIVA